jgi:pyridoxal phosphate-dependent aminotransferase EpsN
MKKILLSVPHMGGKERHYVEEAFATNWLSTIGPNISAFEEEFAAKVGRPAVALASGTAALHLGLRLLGVGPGDEVISPTLTFVATVNPIVYQGASPVFVDSERRTWQLDPERLAEAIEDRIRLGRTPKAVVVVHLYGQCADMDPIQEICERHGIPILEDAAEALGADYKGQPAGAMGTIGIYSFNGNKIITTTGGGMLVARDRALVDKARYWSTQAREPRIEYHHVEVGYNYRMSNVLAGIGRGQLEVLEQRVEQRRQVAFRYRAAFADLPGIELMPQASHGRHTNWLSVFEVDPKAFGATRDELLQQLDAAGIEARPVWKPMHLQPVYADAPCYGGAVATDLYERGICLPSSSSITPEEQEVVVAAVRRAARR